MKTAVEVLDTEAAKVDATRCQKTKNPFGTDTWAVGHPCTCDVCLLAVSNNRLERALRVALGNMKMSTYDTRKKGKDRFSTMSANRFKRAIDKITNIMNGTDKGDGDV